MAALAKLFRAALLLMQSPAAPTVLLGLAVLAALIAILLMNR